MWVKPWLGRKINLGLYETLVRELRFDIEPLSPSEASINDSILTAFAMVKKVCEI